MPCGAPGPPGARDRQLAGDVLDKFQQTQSLRFRVSYLRGPHPPASCRKSHTLPNCSARALKLRPYNAICVEIYLSSNGSPEGRDGSVIGHLFSHLRYHAATGFCYDVVSIAMQ